MIPMKIAIRLDDICEDMDWGKFLRFKELLDKKGIKPLIGIVPDCQDPKLQFDNEENKSKMPEDYWEYIKSLGKEGYTLAMHGVTHVYKTECAGNFPMNDFSEFAGLPYEEQYEAIKRGKEILQSHGIETSIFMPPGHTYDDNTVRALKENGFDVITDAFLKEPCIDDGMKYYPISFMQKLSILRAKKPGFTVFVVHTSMMNDSDFAKYEGYFSNPELEFADYSQLNEMASVKRTKGIITREKNLVRIKKLLRKVVGI